MQIPISRRAQMISPFLAMEVMEKAKSLEAVGRDISIFAWVSPTFRPPRQSLQLRVRRWMMAQPPIRIRWDWQSCVLKSSSTIASVTESASSRNRFWSVAEPAR